MATDIERLLLEISASTRGLERGLNNMERRIDGSTRKAERSFQRMNRNILMSTSSLASDMGGALAAIAVAFAAREVTAYADAWTLGANRLATAGIAADRVADTQARLAQMARETRTALEPTVDLYSRMRRATQDLEVADEAVARATEIVNKAFVAGGAAASEQAAAITQLGQALGSGVLQGDELRSLRENAPIVARAIAEEFNTTVAGLKALGAEGQLTSDRVFRAILRSGAEVDAQFARTEATVGASFENLRTAAIEYIGVQNEATGATATFNGFLEHVTENIDTFIDATVVGATILGGVFAGQAIGAAIRASIAFAATLGITNAAITATGVRAVAATAGVRLLSRALAFFGGPIGLAVAAVATAVGLIAYEANKSVPPTDALTGSVDALNGALDAYETAAIAASVASGENRTSAVEEANALRVVANEARIAAQAKIDLARATLAAAAAAQASWQTELAQSGRDPGMGTFNYVRDRAQRGPSRSEVRQAQADLEAGNAALAEAEARLERIDALMNAPIRPITPTGDTASGGGRRGGGGRTVEDIQLQAALDEARERGDRAAQLALEDQLSLRQRIADYEDAGLSNAQARLRAEADHNAIVAARTAAFEEERAILADDARLQAARLSYDEDAIRALDQAIERRELIQAYEDTGLSNAEARVRAEADLATIEAGRARGRDRDAAIMREQAELQAADLAGEIERSRELQLQADRRDLITRYQEIGFELTEATRRAEADLAEIERGRMAAQREFWRERQADHERRLAELSLEHDAVRRIERAEEIRRRSEQYRAEGRMSPADADRRATDEVDAEARASLRGQFRDAFREGWREAIEGGDIMELLRQRAADALAAAAERGIDALADLVFDTLSEAFPEFMDQLAGIPQDTAAASTMATAIQTSTATGATAISTAIASSTTAGATGIGAAISGGGATAATTIGAAMTAAGQAAAAAIAAAMASGGGDGEGIGAALDFLGKLGGGGGGTKVPGKAGGGYARAGTSFRINEHGTEGFSPGFNGTIVPADVMRALSQLRPGAYATAGRNETNVNVQNLGEPMQVTAERDANGDLNIRLEPLIDKGIKSAGARGVVKSSLKASPQPDRSF